MFHMNRYITTSGKLELGSSIDPDKAPVNMESAEAIGRRGISSWSCEGAQAHRYQKWNIQHDSVA